MPTRIEIVPQPHTKYAHSWYSRSPCATRWQVLGIVAGILVLTYYCAVWRPLALALEEKILGALPASKKTGYKVSSHLPCDAPRDVRC